MKLISLDVIFPVGVTDAARYTAITDALEAKAQATQLALIADGMELGGLVAVWREMVRAECSAEASGYDATIAHCAEALRLLLAVDDRRSTDFLALVAGVLHTLAFAHYKLGNNKRAEKELVKAQKLLDRLAKKDNHRFAASLVQALAASTDIFRSKLKLMNLLAHYQVAADLYQDKVTSGVSTAVASLVDALKKQGDLHLQMCNYRDAVKFYTKALRYAKKVTPTIDLLQLQISVNLAKALLNIINRHAAGHRLLESLLPIAQKLGAKAEEAEIRALQLAPEATDFLSLLKKLF
ncbi:MAG: hypothetical protein ACI4UN_04545 [Muribaculaceae bacterium]